MGLLDLVAESVRRLKQARRRARRWHQVDPRGSTSGALPLVFWPEKWGPYQPLHSDDSSLPGLTPPPTPAATGVNWVSGAGGVLTVVVIIAAWQAGRLATESDRNGQPVSPEATSEAGEVIENDFQARSGRSSGMDLDAQSSASSLSRRAGAAEMVAAEAPYGAAVVLKQVEPTYPPAAKQAGVEGMVIVTYSLDAHGRPTDLQVTKSIPGLDEAALAALRQWQYTKPPPGSTQKYRFNAEFVLD